MAWAVASVSGASSRRSSARRARVVVDRRAKAGQVTGVRPPIRASPSRAPSSRQVPCAASFLRRPSATSKGAPVAGRPLRRCQQNVEERRVDRAGRSAARGTADPSRRATTTAGSSSLFVRARTARVDPSSGQERIARSSRTVSSDASGARTSRPVAAGPARIASRTARRCARRGALPARRPAAGSGSSPRGRPVEGRATRSASPRIRRTSASRQP